MGPIIQERAASTTLEHVVCKEKVRVKNTENSGPNTSLKKGKQMKKAAGQGKSGQAGPSQDQNNVGAVQKGSQPRSSRLKAGTSRNTSKLSSPAEEQNVRHVNVLRHEERRTSHCSTPLQQNHHRGMGKNRHALSLPLSPISGLRHMPEHPLTHSPTPILEALHDPYKVDDSDSASDLSDSERLPVLPSPCTPCTPPHLNLRAEVISCNDFPPDIPGPHGDCGGGEDKNESETPTHSYPDFLPPPFNTWSLRQLAVFLHTEGRGAPRPKPVRPLERFLERLLQLEWLQIQTVQTEISRPPGRPQVTAGHSPRPHTAPSSRLNSPKGPRQSQRAFPCVINPPSPASAATQHQLSRLPVCPHCHLRYPLCNGSCSAYAYQRHSRLSPLLERRTRPGAPMKRSCSETQEATKEGRGQGAQGAGGVQFPLSPSVGRRHLRHMQAVGNVRKQAQESATTPNGKSHMKKSRVRANSVTDVKKDQSAVKAVGADKRVLGSSKKEAKKSEKEAGDQPSKPTVKKSAKEPQSISKAPPNGGKTKNVQSAAK
ncbi:uncharacterized protein fam217ba isoform X1 [Nerophis lumbriciformis]|uniref:uncharacterized protein fam217ba isoform X1 n=1 Tax=Nerophis lumbriciformis TaxID=546530 RepID=UPI002AE03463|nr:uncharacterized protein fam217ba isoform X1 [Nerophis lumbriciformis]